MFLLFSCLIIPVISTWDLEPKLDCWEECFYEGNIYDKKVNTSDICFNFHITKLNFYIFRPMKYFIILVIMSKCIECLITSMER